MSEVENNSIILVDYNHKSNNTLKENKGSEKENIHIFEDFINLYPQNILLEEQKKDIYINICLKKIISLNIILD